MNDNAVVTIPPGVTTTIPGTDLQIHHNSAVTQSVTVSGGTVDLDGDGFQWFVSTSGGGK